MFEIISIFLIFAFLVMAVLYFKCVNRTNIDEYEEEGLADYYQNIIDRFDEPDKGR